MWWASSACLFQRGFLSVSAEEIMRKNEQRVKSDAALKSIQREEKRRVENPSRNKYREVSGEAGEVDFSVKNAISEKQKSKKTKQFPSRADTSIIPCIVSPPLWQNQLLVWRKTQLISDSQELTPNDIKNGNGSDETLPPLRWDVSFLNYHLDNCRGDIQGFHFPPRLRKGIFPILQTFTGQGALPQPDTCTKTN